MSRLKLAVMISGRGSNLQALIDATADPTFPAEIILVLSNRPGAMGLERAAKAGIPTRVIDHKGFADRAAFDAEMTAAMEAAGTELVCLAGFMRLLSDEFVDHWRDRMINIHPSLLPAFKGLDVQERVLAQGARFAGCTVHYVRKEMDTGPIIVQAVVPVHPDDTPDSLAARVLEREHDIYPLAVRLIAEGRVTIDENDRAVITGAVAQESALLNPKG
ncbi:phosphoribosylglycinamide formyltransferase [Thalassospiraceae bacterium LMO-SO8]|nr:phosphoribosylglycinamide formyltransferase [Alphaproteobacteria bacterium LMO-S08]WND76052.1 phosphoribosylglycinamide formyltransferase [Thalassospiraceae bacterium LMO-SO8]